MSSSSSGRPWPAAALPCALLLGLAAAPPALAQDAASLGARHAALLDELRSSPFQRPLHLESHEASGDVRGDVYARVAQPFAVAAPALHGMRDWCDILILHLNVKRCRTASPGGRDTLSLNVGRKSDQPLADSYLFEFHYEVTASGPGYQRVALSAAEGPLGTSRYRIVLELMPLDTGRSFLHLSYAYGQGTTARWATQAYLATIGRAKIGFSVIGRKADAQPVYIGGARGVIERNAMRYYLAIEAYLGALASPVAERPEQRLKEWFDSVERYPAQLHEIERGEYLRMKRLEIRRQKLALAAGR